MAENETDETPLTPVAARAKLTEESALVADLVMSALAVLHNSDANVSLIGEFIGLVGVTGGVGTSIIAAAEERYVVELAKFFAGRFEDAAKVFRRVEAGESVHDIMAERDQTEALLSGEPDAGGVVLD